MVKRQDLTCLASGFTFIGLLIIVALSGIALSAAGIVWHQHTQREHEKELLYVGEAYKRAIGSYYENTPSGIKEYPSSLDELVLDKRFPIIKRHIRKLYENPITPNKPWVLILQQGKIIGLYSDSLKHPIKKSGFNLANQAFSEASTYRDWQFTYTPG